MKKITHFISFLIAFLLGGILFPFTVKASSPAPTQSTIELINIADELITSLMLTDHYVMPVTSNLSGFNASMNFGALPYSDLWQWDSSDFSVSSLSGFEFNTLTQDLSIYNDLGTEITSSDDIFRIDFDNGLFHGSGYVDSEGNILYTTDNLGGQLLQVAIGGNQVDVSQFLINLQGLAEDIEDNNYYLYPSNLNMTSRSYYLYFGRKEWRTVLTGYIYVSDMYNEGVTVGTNMNNGHACQYFLTNDLSTIKYANLSGTPIKLYSGSWTYNGYTYSYRIEIPYDIQNGSSSDINDLNNGNPGYTVYNLSQTQFVYDSSLFHSESDVLAFKKAVLQADSKIIEDPTGIYDYESLDEAYKAIIQLADSKNTNFDPSLSISPTNYPDYTPIPQSITIEQSGIPDTQPDPPPESDPTANPEIEDLPDPIDPSLVTDNIPIISGLQNKFPFSIPWDIYKLIKGLSVPREVPVLEYEIQIPIINYTWEISIDLTMYNQTATLFRTLFLITFIIGLAVFSYHHFFGS